MNEASNLNREYNLEETLLLEEVKQWIEGNRAQFYENCHELYDKNNLERIKRFSNSPDKYLEERLDLNKEVLKNYHRLHHSILLGGLTGFYILVLANYVNNLVEAYQEITLVKVLILLILIVAPLVAFKIRITTLVLKWSGLLRVIRDSEIEVYYITKIMEFRAQKSIETKGNK